MKISINGRTVLHLPTRMLLSGIVRRKIAQYVPDEQEQLAVREMLLHLCKNRRQYKGWVLVEVQSHKGDAIDIVL